MQDGTGAPAKWLKADNYQATEPPRPLLATLSQAQPTKHSAVMTSHGKLTGLRRIMVRGDGVNGHEPDTRHSSARDHDQPRDHRSLPGR
jgi:hypothetical protein